MTTPHGQHTGALISDLPVIDLVTRHCGKWNGNIDLKKSKIVTFQGEKVLQVHHDKGSGSTATDPRAVGGVQGFFTPTGLPLADGGYVFGFDVFFPTGYKFAKGGKFGGVYMGEGSASGGHHSPSASSNRIMFQVDGGAILYVYPPLGAKQADPRLQGDPDYGFGVFNKEFAKCLKTGQWNHLEIGTKMNTLTNGKPNADGIGSLTVNGVTHVIPRVVWRTGHWSMVKLVFNEFFGGPDNSPVDQDCMYKNFAVYKWKD